MANNKNKEIADKFETVRRLAADMTEPVDMRKLYTYSAYLQGARKAMEVMAARFPQIFKGKEAVYNRAEYELAVASLRNTDLYLTNGHEIRFRNHVSDRKGKCTKCEAYFAGEADQR